jgi:hypothetical protein
MRAEKHFVHLFEKGDRVNTWDGNGTILEDEKYSEFVRQVKVQLDEPNSSNPSNVSITIDSIGVDLIGD